jgi:hypothetical protein
MATGLNITLHSFDQVVFIVIVIKSEICRIYEVILLIL